MNNLYNSRKKNRTYVDKIEQERNKYRSYVLNTKELEYLIDYLKSNISDQDKANKLTDFCDYTTILHSITYYTKKNPNCRELIWLKEIKNMYEYYDIKELLFKKKTYKCTLKELNERIEKLKKVDEILNSNKIDYIKVEQLISLFNDSEEFRRAYSLLIKLGKNDKKLDCIRPLLNNFDTLYYKFVKYEEKGIIDDVKYLLKIESYQRNYMYAKFAINHYINSDDSYKLKKFLTRLGLDKETFNFCVSTIEELDVDLYKKYMRKYEENKIKRFNSNVLTISDLANGIKNGYLNNGTPFTLLEFLKKIPFKYSDNFMLSLTNFMKKNNPKDYKTIMTYIYSNRLNAPSTFTKLNLKNIYSKNTKTIVRNVEITEEINNIIIDYLIANDLPLITKAYIIVRDKYLNGEIDIEKLNRQRKIIKNKSMVLIPSSKQS